MKFSSQRFVDVVVASPTGRIDQTCAEAFQQSLMHLLDEGDPPAAGLVLDFSAVDYISSVGLRVVMMAARQLRSRSARIAVSALQPVVGEIFEISRFHHVVEIHATLRDGVQALSSPALAAFDHAHPDSNA